MNETTIAEIDTTARWATRQDLVADRLQETPEFLRGYRAALDDLRAHLAGRRQRVLQPATSEGDPA